MAKRVLGYILIGLGLLGVLYFKSYKGDVIPVPFLWLIVSIGVVALGTYLITIAKTKLQIHGLNNLNAQLNRIKETGERIKVDLDNCDFKTTNIYDQGKAESFSRVQMLDALYDANRNHNKKIKTLTYILYKHQNGGKTENYVSKPFQVDEAMLKFYVSNNKIVLYVDRRDRKQYFFDVQR
jgi:hypothetical protein